MSKLPGLSAIESDTSAEKGTAVTVETQVVESRKGSPSGVLGGYTALAESFWMGAAQAWDVLEPAKFGRGARRIVPGLRGLLTREFTVTEASIILMASFFASALLGAIRQILFNAQFGAGTSASAYYAAFRLPDTLFSLIAGGALSSAMIPVLLGTESHDGESGATHLTNLVLNALLGAFVLLVVAAELLAPAFVSHVLAPGFDSSTSRLTVTLTRIMLIQPVILAVGSVAIAVLNSRSQFLLTALSIASHNIGLIGGIVASELHPALGIYGPTLGVVAGAFLQAVIVVPGLLQRGFRYKPELDFSDPRLHEVITLLIPNGLAVGVGYAGFIVDTAFASKAPEGAALPALHNAFLLVGLPIALLGQAIGQSVFPRVAALAEAQDWRRLRYTVLRALGIAVALAVPTVAALVFLGHPAIRVLFQHGKFGAGPALLTYHVLIAYTIALPAYVGSEIVTRALIAVRDTRTPLFTNTVQVAGRIAIMVVLLGAIGVEAIPVAFAVMASLEAVVLTAILLGRLQRRLRLAEGPIPVSA